MKWPVSLLFIFLLHHAAIAQCDSVLFRNTATLLYDVSLIDADKIVAVGDNGYIIKSSDGGKNWRNIKSPATTPLKSVQMVTDSVGYAVGTQRTILKTEDGGESWFPLYARLTDNNSYSYSETGTFTDVHFFTNNRGYITGENGIVLSTSDGGKSWSYTFLTTEGLATGLSSFHFINDSLAFACGGGNILYKTVNAWRTWQSITVNAVSYYQGFTKVKFIDSVKGFLIGSNGTCLKTTDGGTTWSSIFLPSGGGGIYYDIQFVTPSKGFMVGAYSSGILLQTTNGGDSWSVFPNTLSTAFAYYAISADALKKKVVVAGGDGRSILVSDDAGTSFTPQSGNAKTDNSDIFFLNDSTGYLAATSSYAYKTSDYGETWKPLQRIPVYYGGNPVSKMMFTDTLNGYAASDIISKTTDGGATWSKTPTTPGGQVQFFAKQIHFYDALKGLVQDNYAIYKTTNGGTTWSNVLSGGSNAYYTDFATTPAGKVFAVGLSGRCNVSLNEGSTWSVYNLGTTQSLTGVYFYNNLKGYIGTNDTILYRTVDGGSSWTRINTGITGGWEMRSFHFVNDLVGYLLCYSTGGANSLLCKTNDGGLTWTRIRQDANGGSRITGFKTLYYTGGGGLIVKTDSLQKPTQVGYLYGPAGACVGDKSVLVAGPTAGASYNWVLSSGGTQTYRANRDTITWSTPGMHTVSYAVSNACGTSPVRQLVVDVIQFQPTITVQDSVLTATAGATYQWFRNGVALTAAEGVANSSIIGRIDGSYTVRVKSAYGCTVTSAAVVYAGIPAPLCPNGGTTIVSNLSSTGYQWQRDVGNGFAAVFNNANYSGTNTSTLQLNNIPSSWYGYKFRCITNAGYSNVFALQFVNRWTGSTNISWENVANWSCGTIPDANTDVVITSGTIIISSNVTIRKLTISPAASLTVQSGNTLTITH